jgi:hypothetical protein
VEGLGGDVIGMMRGTLETMFIRRGSDFRSSKESIGDVVV